MPINGKNDLLPSNQSIWSLFENSVLREPFHLAVTDATSKEEITFSELLFKINQLSRFLQKLLKRSNQNLNADGDRVIAVCIPPSIELIVTLFSILQVKGAYLPLDVDFPISRVNHILEDAKPQLLITVGDQPAVSHLKTNDINGVSSINLDSCKTKIQNENGDSIDGSTIDAPPSCESLLAILYTSGSTGIPKGVRVSQKAALNRLVWQWRTFPFVMDEICCFKTALTFVDSISEIFGPLLTNHQLVVIPKAITRNVEQLNSVLDDHRIGRLVLVPSLLRSILLHVSRKPKQLKNLRLWICSGEIFPPDLLYSFFDYFKQGQRICNFYGSTEVMGDVTYISFASQEDIIDGMTNKKVPIGYPISNSTIYLVDENLQEVRHGEVGEIVVCGYNLALGYVGNSRSEKFRRNPHSNKSGFNILYRTGDFGRFVNGKIVFEGRKDSQLKVRGHRVDLSEIESTVQGIRGVDKCTVVCYRPSEIDQAILAFYTSFDDDITSEYLSIRIATLLPNYMQPQFVRVDEMPLLVNGKIDRQKLLKTYEDLGFKAQLEEIEMDTTGCPEGYETTAKDIIKTIKRTLGPVAPKKISLNQNFFKIGGNSLNALLTITSLQDTGYNIGIGDFLQANCLLEILKKCNKIDDKPFTETDTNQNNLSTCKNLSHFKCGLLRVDQKNDVINMIAKSFVSKGDLEVLLHIKENEYVNILEQMWPAILSHNLSFGVIDAKSNDLVAVSINLDLYNEPDILFPTRNLKYIFDFLEECETKVRFFLPDGPGKIMHSVMMSTKESSTPMQNVSLIECMEKENINIARSSGYEVIFTTNTSNLTQHVCDDLLPYKVLATYKVNQWKSEDYVRPFQKAPDDQHAVCSALFLQDLKKP